VPFLVRWPGRIRPGATDALLSTPDIMPTLLGALGLPVPRAAEGTDLSRTRLRSWMKDHNDQFESCTWYRDRWTMDRNIVNTATGVKQDLTSLESIVRQTAREIEGKER